MYALCACAHQPVWTKNFDDHLSFKFDSITQKLGGSLLRNKWQFGRCQTYNILHNFVRVFQQCIPLHLYFGSELNTCSNSDPQKKLLHFVYICSFRIFWGPLVEDGTLRRLPKCGRGVSCISLNETLNTLRCIKGLQWRFLISHNKISGFYRGRLVGEKPGRKMNTCGFGIEAKNTEARKI